MACLLCLTSALVRKKKPRRGRTCSSKSRWSAIVAENAMGEIHQQRLSGPIKTLTGRRKNSLVLTFCLQTPREESLQRKRSEGRMAVDILCGMIEGRKKKRNGPVGEKSLEFAVFGSGVRHCHVAPKPVWSFQAGKCASIFGLSKHPAPPAPV